jgi:hypothetical protein
VAGALGGVAVAGGCIWLYNNRHSHKFGKNQYVVQQIDEQGDAYVAPEYVTMEGPGVYR